MAKPKTPLLSLGATGTLGGVLTHRRHKGQTIAETKPVPTDQRTPAQLIHRAIFRLGCDWWPAIPEAQRWLYHQMNPRIGANPAFLNFMKEWLMTQVVLHHEQHEAGGADEMDLTGLQGAGGFDWSRYLKLARYHHSPLVCTDAFPSAKSHFANKLYTLPYPIPITMTFDRIGIQIFTAAAGLLRLGLYADNGATYPGALLIDAGTVDVSTIGFKAITINQQLTPSLYWLASLSNVIPVIRTQISIFHPLIGKPGADPGYGMYEIAYGYAPLPNPYPAAAGLASNIHNTVLRRSA